MAQEFAKKWKTSISQQPLVGFSNGFFCWFHIFKVHIKGGRGGRFLKVTISRMGQYWIKTQIEITEYKGLDVPCFLLRELNMTRLVCAMEDYKTSSVVGAGWLVFGFWSKGRFLHITPSRMGQFWIKTQTEITEYKGLDVPCFLLRELSMTRLACAMEDYKTSSVVGAGWLVFGFWGKREIPTYNA